MLARVIAVADTFDALTTNRPYQQAHTPEQALQIIKNLAGKRHDPQAVEALLAVCARGDIKIQRFTIKRPIAPQPAETSSAAVYVAAAAALPEPRRFLPKSRLWKALEFRKSGAPIRYVTQPFGSS